MKILLTAAAIISSTGFGVSQSPARYDSIPSAGIRLVQAGIDTGRYDPRDAVDAVDATYAIDALDALDGVNASKRQASSLPPEPWAAKDPADSLYKLAREAMSRGDYKRAAELFHRIPERYPQSAYATQAIYYEAFALYRSGGDDDLSTARDRLKQLEKRDAKLWKNDGAVLLTRVCGELAKRGDEDCAADIEKRAQDDRPAQGNTSCGDNDDKIAALNALLQMDAERAMPILKKVLEKRDPCSAELRRQALFLVSQKRTEETATILMNAARNDPDSEVREKAVFWLSQVPGSTPLLEGILKGSGDQNIKEQALFALSQQNEPRSQQVLREFAMRESEPEELRDKAIFWLGQRRSSENTEFLRNLYSRIGNQELKEKILFSLSQQRGAGNEQWLMNIVVNPREDIELRKKALFWAGQMGAAIPEISRLYDRINDTEMREQIIFVLSQRQRDPAAMDKLFDIAKNEKDAELRKKAIFWLGQSRDPRVQQFLMDLINK